VRSTKLAHVPNFFSHRISSLVVFASSLFTIKMSHSMEGRLRSVLLALWPLAEIQCHHCHCLGNPLQDQWPTMHCTSLPLSRPFFMSHLGQSLISIEIVTTWRPCFHDMSWSTPKQGAHIHMETIRDTHVRQCTLPCLNWSISYHVSNVEATHGVPNHMLACTTKFVALAWMNTHLVWIDTWPRFLTIWKWANLLHSCKSVTFHQYEHLFCWTPYIG
jgi:hypothetical protein